MDFFRGVAEMFTSSILRLLVAAGTLALVYFLIVKPVLHTTEDAINKANRPSTVHSRQIQRSISRDIRHTSRQVRHQINQTLRGAGVPRQEKLLHCIQRAAGDVNRMQACSRRFSG
jgi:hypothetical protein